MNGETSNGSQLGVDSVGLKSSLTPYDHPEVKERTDGFLGVGRKGGKGV